MTFGIATPTAAAAALGGYPDISLPEECAGQVEMVRSIAPRGAYYLVNHRGRLMPVRPDERPFLTGEMIRHMTWTAGGTR